MTDKKTELRKRAEEKASHLPEDLDTLHELRVHQIELEIQNDELREAQAELNAERARYFDLYDLAPVGYCTISEKGLILEANLTAATLLGETRGGLVQQPLSRFILKEDLDTFYRLRKQLFDIAAASPLGHHPEQAGQADAPQAYELRMLKKDGTTFWAHLETAVQVTATAETQAETSELRIILSDITLRKRVEETLQERLKELNCLYGIAALVELPGISLDEILTGTVLLLPYAWQFPEIAEASIVLREKNFQTAHFQETSWMQIREIIVNGKPIGQVKVC